MKPAIALFLSALVALGEDIRTLNVQNLTIGGEEYQWYKEMVRQESSLQGYWRLGETSGNFADSSAAGNTATASGVTHNVTSLTGSQATNGAATFDGTDDKAVLASSSLFDWERTQSFSVEFLIKPNFPRSGASERIPVFSKLESSGNTRGFEISVEYASGVGKAYVRGTVGNTIESNRSESRNMNLDLANGQVYHVVVTYDGTSHPHSFDYWINGVQEPEVQISGNVNATILSSVAPSIGGRADDGLFGPGTIDEVSVYDAVLTPTQILNHYSAALLGSYAQLKSPLAPKIIFDTDMNTDCDDVGALAIIHAMQKLGECQLIACGASASNPDIANAIDAINTWYGRGNIPVGRFTGSPELQPTGHAWVTGLKNNFPNDIGVAPSAVTLYRQALAAQPNDSVIMLMVGFSTNLLELLNSGPDHFSSMNGAQLVTSKVYRLVVMGGRYNGNGQPIEFNFASDINRASELIANWPTPMMFIGSENGNFTSSGGTLWQNTPANNPVRYAYHQAGFQFGRESWDPIAALYAVRPWLFREIPGSNSINVSSGTNTWLPTLGGEDRRVCQETTKDQLESILNNLMDAAP